MTPYTIIWDFDGTLYPLDPYDSEHNLLRMRRRQLEKKRHRLRGGLTGGLIYGDMHQWFRSIYSRKLYSLLYGWALRGTPIALLDRTAEHTAALISMEDRNALHSLHGDGLRMLIISCGTLDLCERVLQKAGVRDCFETIKANPLILKGDRIAGIEPRVVAAEDKLSIAKKLIGSSPKEIIAVGDGYTDIPLLDWAQFPVMMDKDHSQQQKYAAKPYYFIRSVGDLPLLLTRLLGRSMG